jgi:hypothetical protein
MSKSFEIFQRHYQSVEKIIRSADIYTIHAFSKLKNEEPNIKLIDQYFEKDRGHSTLINGWFFHMTEEERKQLGNDPHIYGLSEQIVTSTYVAVEYYLVNKFNELIELTVSNKSIVNGIAKNIKSTSLDMLKKRYGDFLEVDLSRFNPDITLFETEWFKPKTCWDGLKMLSTVRNEVAHTGRSKTFVIKYLHDSYAAYDFAWYWVSNFEATMPNRDRVPP